MKKSQANFSLFEKCEYESDDEDDNMMIEPPKSPTMEGEGGSEVTGKLEKLEVKQIFQPKDEAVVHGELREYTKKEITKRQLTTFNTSTPQNEILTGKKVFLLNTVNQRLK